MNLLSALSPIAVLKRLFKGEESSTFQRLLRSQHVADLQLIFQITVIAMILASMLALFLCAVHEDMKAFAAAADSGVFISAVWAVGCGVVAWAYRAGSARLGVVDLYACEIATLCRVTLVADAVQHYVGLDKHMPEDTNRFSSQESYFPIFDSTARDLQQLEEMVVKNVTAFYTYMKVTRDYMRKLADIQPGTPGAREKWQAAIGNVMYMLFLALESARLSIGDLVEFEPTRAEDTITILLSELTAYAYLRDRFTDDFLSRRLNAREPGYRRDVAHLICTVQSRRGPEWEKPKDIAEELMKRYARIFTPQEQARCGRSDCPGLLLAAD